MHYSDGLVEYILVVLKGLLLHELDFRLALLPLREVLRLSECRLQRGCWSSLASLPCWCRLLMLHRVLWSLLQLSGDILSDAGDQG